MPFTSLCFIGKNKSVRSLRKTLEGEILHTLGKYQGLGKENLVENMLEDLSNSKFIGVCRSLSGEGNGQRLLLSVVISEVTLA